MCTAQQGQAQLIMDALTGSPIPFANILVVDNPDVGTSSGEDGGFVLDVPVGTEIRITSVGYKPQNVAYTGPDLIVLLENQIAEIEEVVITADESEAARVLRLCVKNRKKTAPNEQPHFQCTLYNKYRVDMLRDSLAEPSKLIRMLEKRLQGETVFFSESAMTYNYEKPGKVEQHIVANKVAGFEEAQFNFLPEQIISFDINNDFLDLLNRHYLLPTSKGSERHYGLHLEETAINGNDTTWLIQFWPEHSSYDLLRGHIIINSDQYAIEEYRLTNNKKDYQKFDIYHYFRRFNGRWFPQKMISKVVMSDPALNVNVLYDQKTHVKEVAFDAVPIKTVDVNRMAFEEGVQDNPEWIAAYRVEALTSGDSVAIENVNTSADNLNLEKKVDLIANLSFGRLPVGPVDLEIARFVWSNKTEGYRPGLGVFTNRKFSEKFELHGFFGYGLGDKQWKYGGGITWFLNKNRTAGIYTKYEKEIYPISSYVVTNGSSRIISNFYTDQLDDITAYHAGLKGRFSNLKYDLSVSRSKNTPRYGYEFIESPENILSAIDVTEFKLQLNYIKRKFVPFYTYEIELENFNSTFWDFSIAYAPKDILDSDINYFRVESFVKRPFNLKHFGRVELAVHAGATIGDRPLNRIQIGPGTNSGGIPYQLPYGFNTMAPFSRFADRHVHIFYDHRFVRLYQSRLSAPYLHIAQQSGWGLLKDKNVHRLNNEVATIDDYRQGYHETGLIFESLLRYEVFSVMNLGLHAGTWYRWGPYAAKKFKDDFALKVGFSIGF